MDCRQLLRRRGLHAPRADLSDLLAVSRDNNFLSGLDEPRQFGEAGFGSEIETLIMNEECRQSDH